MAAFNCLHENVIFLRPLLGFLPVSASCGVTSILVVVVVVVCCLSFCHLGCSASLYGFIVSSRDFHLLCVVAKAVGTAAIWIWLLVVSVLSCQLTFTVLVGTRTVSADGLTFAVGVGVSESLAQLPLQYPWNIWLQRLLLLVPKSLLVVSICFLR